MNLSIARIKCVYCKNERRLLRKLKALLANENIELVVMKTSKCERMLYHPKLCGLMYANCFKMSQNNYKLDFGEEILCVGNSNISCK